MTRVRRRMFITGAAFLLTAVTVGAGEKTPGQRAAGTPQSFYDLKAVSLQGHPQDLAQYKGKVALVVNVASQCGFTPQYKALQALREEMKPHGFEVLGFPSNDFGGQEPGSAEEIQTFCQKNYGVSFPMFQKLVTRAGDGQSPIYTYLGKSGHLPEWNFAKYVIGKDGHVKAFFPSKVTPGDPKLRQAVDAALAE